MRVKGIIAVLIITGIGFGLSFLVTDQWIENTMEYQASVINGAKVEIDNLDFELFGMSFEWDRLQVANPEKTMRNTFETGKAEFDLQVWPWLIGDDVVIENMQLSGFQLDTERETDGSFDVPEPEADTEPGFIASITNQVASEVKANAQTRFEGISSKINADSLVAMVDLQSIEKMDSLKTEAQQTFTLWENRIGDTNFREDVTTIAETTKNINPKEIKDPKKIVSTIKNVQKLKEQADSLKKQYQQIKTDFQQDITSTTQTIGQIDNWIQQDIDRAARLAQLPKLDIQNMAGALFGQKLLSDFNMYLGYVRTGREYLNRARGEDKTEKIPRYEGIDYHFSDKYDNPSFWIKNIDLSGKTKNNISLAGFVTDISSNQKKAGAPTKIDLSGEDENQVAVTLRGEFNYLGEKPKEQFTARYSNFSLKNGRLSPSSLVPYQLQDGNGSITANLDIEAKRIRSEISYVAEAVRFDFESADKAKNRLESLIRTALQSTDQINATAIVENTDGPLKIRVRSNLDDLFLDAVKSTISKEVADARAKIKNEVEQRVNEKKEEVREFATAKKDELTAKFDQYEKQVTDQLAVVEQKRKELEERKKELEKGLLNKAKDKIGIDF